jgi:hypothetical protein
LTSKTATVETLTAEVRVLMVGSRQVTMSVYNQLDTAEYEDTELFGRVSPRDAEYGYIYFIGRHRENGSLIRGSVPSEVAAIKNENPMLWDDIRGLRDEIVNFSGKIADHRRGTSWSVRCSKEDHSQCTVHIRINGQWMNRQIAAVEADIERLRNEMAELEREGRQELAGARALAAAVSELPLIVLAGLR